MARARSPDSIEAEKLYKEGMLLVDIARKLGKPEGTIRRWKSTQNWDSTEVKNKKKESERSLKKKANVRKSKGAPAGNKNAVGHVSSVPIGNKNAWKHGGYSSIYFDSLDDKEMELIKTMPMDAETLLEHSIMIFTLRERRLMTAIKMYREAKGGVYVSGVTKFEEKRSFKDDKEKELYDERIRRKVKNDERLPGEHYSMQTMTASTADLITRLEKELTSVQRQKTMTIDTLAKLKLEKERIAGGSKGNELVQAWAESVIKARRENGGQ